MPQVYRAAPSLLDNVGKAGADSGAAGRSLAWHDVQVRGSETLVSNVFPLFMFQDGPEVPAL